NHCANRTSAFDRGGHDFAKITASSIAACHDINLILADVVDGFGQETKRFFLLAINVADDCRKSSPNHLIHRSDGLDIMRKEDMAIAKRVQHVTDHTSVKFFLHDRK